MIAPTITIGLVCGTFCWSPWLPHFFLPVDGWLPERPPIVFAPPGVLPSGSGGLGVQKGSLRPRSGGPSGRIHSPYKATNHRIIIGPYVPPLPLPAWLQGAP